MKEIKMYIKSIFKFIVFMIITLSGFVGFILFLDSKSWLALPMLVVWVGSILFGFILMYDNKKCPNCENECGMTGVGGSEYKQWYCEVCKKTFWTTLFLEEYERDYRKTN
jgi:hypothetical protein